MKHDFPPQSTFEIGRSSIFWEDGTSLEGESGRLLDNLHHDLTVQKPAPASFL
jgi:hypothetical protein